MRVLIVSNSGSQRVRLLVYAPISTGNLRRQLLRLQLDVDFFSSRLHAKLIHYMLINHVSEDFPSFVVRLRDSCRCGRGRKTVRSIRSSV